MEHLQNLLSQIALVNKKNNEILEATGGRFNMFGICGVNHYENTHSAILAELLNPKGSHSLKSQFLTAFLETIGKEFTLPDFEATNATVYTEYFTDNGRIDILIKDLKGNALIIENKIYAGDQYEQLKRYNAFAKKNFKSYQIYYLTLYGTEASAQSAEEVVYDTISYAETIIQWLDKCIALAVRLPLVRETLIQYSNHLKQLTNQDMNSKNQEEIVGILANIENLKAAKVISQNYGETFNFIARKYFSPKMESWTKEKGLDYHYEISEEEYVRFYLTKTEWQGRFWIGFTFERGYYYGICNNPNNHKVSEDNRATLREKLGNFGVEMKSSNWWPCYAYIPNLSIDTWESDIIKSDNFFETCKQRIETLLKAIEGLDL